MSSFDKDLATALKLSQMDSDARMASELAEKFALEATRPASKPRAGGKPTGFAPPARSSSPKPKRKSRFGKSPNTDWKAVRKAMKDAGEQKHAVAVAYNGGAHVHRDRSPSPPYYHTSACGSGPVHKESQDGKEKKDKRRAPLIPTATPQQMYDHAMAPWLHGPDAISRPTPLAPVHRPYVSFGCVNPDALAGRDVSFV
jgi:hypothetical protein